MSLKTTLDAHNLHYRFYKSVCSTTIAFLKIYITNTSSIKIISVKLFSVFYYKIGLSAVNKRIISNI